MKRSAMTFMKDWNQKSTRKPLIIRGARQVGKSTLVREFARESNLELIEFNFEIDLLESVSHDEFKLSSLLDEIQLKRSIKISEESLLFFDEIQECPRLLKLLRYFFEQRPELKIIAAGSLLEIALRAEDFSFPVGRVEFYHLGPMTFREFLWATNQNFLDSKLENFEFSPEIHKAGIKALQSYYYVGGMPEAVKVFSESNSLVEMRKIQSQIIQTYQADFPKYNKRVNVQRINRVFSSMALTLGKKIIFSKLDGESQSKEIKKVVESLIDSRVILSCMHSSGNMLPLLGEVDSRIFKTYFLDIGLVNSLLKMDLETLNREFEGNFNTKGILAEQYVAQHLSHFNGSTEPPSLIYHLRDKSTQKAEVDFLIESGQQIIPIEVKSAKAGHLKSLKYFCTEKNSTLAIKMSLAEYSEEPFTENSKLVNIPLYAVDYLKDNLNKIKTGG